MSTDQAHRDSEDSDRGGVAHPRKEGTDWRDLTEALARVDFGIAVLDGDIIRLANEAAERFVGLPLGSSVGRNVVDVVTPSNDIVRDLEELRTGRFQGFRARRSIGTPHGQRGLFWVTMRTVEINGERMMVAIFAPEVQVGQLGRHPIRAWMDVIPICLGTANRQSRIRAISAEVYELLGLLPAECVGSRLVDLVSPAQQAQFSETIADATAPGIFPHVSMSTASEGMTEVCVLLAPAASQDEGLVVFALVGRFEDFYPRSEDRVSDLEMRLRRIAAEVRAAGVMDSLAVLPRLASGRELTDLTTRQWEILSRLAEGQRVPTIADELYISPSTVRNHLAVIFRKFGVHSQAELMERLRGAQINDRTERLQRPAKDL